LKKETNPSAAMVDVVVVVVLSLSIEE